MHINTCDKLHILQPLKDRVKHLLEKGRQNSRPSPMADCVQKYSAFVIGLKVTVSVLNES